MPWVNTKYFPSKRPLPTTLLHSFLSTLLVGSLMGGHAVVPGGESGVSFPPPYTHNAHYKAGDHDTPPLLVRHH